MGQLMLGGAAVSDVAAELNKILAVATFMQQHYQHTISVVRGGPGAEHAVLGSASLELMRQSDPLPQVVGEFPHTPASPFRACML